jgi:16S rRNA (adenine1518-N6/adenine1519-N6)-dimethyltransferase
MQAKKFYGQNFITDKNLILKIISLLQNDGETLVIEIGPGRGALTGELVKQFKKVVAIEIDKDLEEILKAKITADNFELIIADVLEIDWSELLQKYHGRFKNIVLISNTPYYITSEILFKAFRNSEYLQQAILMFQKEVAERVCAELGNSKYNNLSIVSNFYAKPKYEFTVKKNMFNPVPAVDSAIISLDFTNNHKSEIDDTEAFIALVRKLFNNRRKTILNNVKSTLPDHDAAQLLNEAGIVSTLRPENISLEEYINLYNCVIKK